MIALLVMSDGRDDYLDRTMWSMAENLTGISEFWMHDDGGSNLYRADLAARYPKFRHINAGPTRRGFGAAIRSAWTQLDAGSQADHVLHLEADFTFRHPVDAWQLTTVLNANPSLVQMVLRRQPCNTAERAAGGVVEQHPQAYKDWVDGDHHWLEHRLFWSTNPGLYRRSLLAAGWPEGALSERSFTQYLLQHGSPEAPADEVRFGYWGARDSGVWVDHIGAERIGCGY